jgi:hypothetical protein
MNASTSWKPLLGLLPLLALAGCAHDSDQTAQYTTIEPQVYEHSVASKQPITRFADEDKDGKVTRKEAKADPNLERNFAKYDLDKNNILDRGEFARLEAESHEPALTGRSVRDSYEDMYESSSSRSRPGSTLNRTAADEARPPESEY